MSIPSAIRRAFVVHACAVGALVFFAFPSPAQVVTFADLRYDRMLDGATRSWNSSFWITSPAAEYGLPPVALRQPSWLASADRAGSDAGGASFMCGDQFALQARTGPNQWHGTLGELRFDWRRYAGGPRGGAWISLGASGVAGGDQSLRSPLIGIGGSTRWQRFQLIAQLDQTPGYTEGSAARSYTTSFPEESLTVYFHWTEPAVPGILTTITRMQVRGAYGHGRVSLEAAGGMDVGTGMSGRRWMRGSAALAVLPPVTLFASYGSSPTQLFVEETQTGPRGAVGVRLNPAPRVTIDDTRHAAGTIESWRIQRTSEGRYRFTLRVIEASTVEMMGDMTDWLPAVLEPAGGARWQATLEIVPGVHQVLVRADGGPWIVPPHMTSTESEFAGTVGVLVVE